MQRVVRRLWIEAPMPDWLGANLGFWTGRHLMFGCEPCEPLQIPNLLEAKEEAC